MTIEALRGIVLRYFYDRRTTEYFTQTRALVGKVEEANVADICDQLAKAGLIDWYRSSSGPDEGSGRITERGVHLIQGIAIAASSKPEYIGVYWKAHRCR